MTTFSLLTHCTAARNERSRRIDRPVLFLLKGFFALMVVPSTGCAPVPESASVPPTVITNTGDDPSFEIASFNVMAHADLSNVLPYTVQDGEPNFQQDCVVAIDKSTAWDTNSTVVIDEILARRAAVQSAILNWFSNHLLDPDMPSASWTVEVDHLTIRHLAADHIALHPQQDCFTQDSMSLPPNTYIVTTLFGARKLRLKSDTPLTRQDVQKIKAKGRRQRVSITSVLTYKRATDPSGKAISRKGIPMFRAPDDTLVPRGEVPPPGKRPIFELIVSIPASLNFAFGDFPKTYWATEASPDTCHVNLIYDDLIPRIPDCPELKDAGFGIRHSDTPSQTIVVKLSGDNSTADKEIPFDERSLIQAGGRILAWVTPRSLEEGALLEIDTVVLRPSTEKTDNLIPFKMGREPRPSRKR